MPTPIRRLASSQSDFLQNLNIQLAFEAAQDDAIERAVITILNEVKTHGDAAVLAATDQFDGIKAQSVKELELSRETLQTALLTLPEDQRAALEVAARQVRSYHERQKDSCGADGFLYLETNGNLMGQRVTPLDRVGIYVPGGKAAYPSSVLMNAIPAKVAGVSEIIMVVPTPNGMRNDMVLAAAAIAEVDRVFTLGGAQAIAALAYGTQTIPAVDKIVGPGNAYVAAAKRRMFGTVGIDMIAGPSEILILSDGTTPPDWIAMDLFAQAEHDELAQAILISPDARHLEKVQSCIDVLLPTMERKEVIEKSLTTRGLLVKSRDMADACGIANHIAPEHLEISTQNPRQWLPLIRHAGAIFLGAHACEALGDYCAGPNHVLPTSRTSRFSSPLGVYDFQKRSSIMEISAQGAQNLAKIAYSLACGEGLQAHARSAEMRLSNE